MFSLPKRLAAPLLAALALAFATAPGLAQTPPAPAPVETAPAETMPIPGPPAPQPLQPGDAFGEEVMLPGRTIIFLKGQGNWEAAFDTLADAFKSLNQYFAKQGIKPNGPAMTVYTQTDDKGFTFEAALPVAEAPANPPTGDIAVGQSPTGRALKFVHRGSFDAMDSTYEAVTNHLDEKQLDAKDMFIEEYATDPSAANPENMVVTVYVPVK
ncbi:MAG: GyrI-like domain-containing protein [Pseudolabrys sp.]|nr:GyrI-like domain-containing protein [Pseudolabrys sp.]